MCERPRAIAGDSQRRGFPALPGARAAGGEVSAAIPAPDVRTLSTAGTGPAARRRC